MVMSGPSRYCVLAFLACAAKGAVAAEAVEHTTENVVIRKVGYPEVRFEERAACGQLVVAKSVLNPEYLFRVVFGSFREGSCAAIGYTQFEKAEAVRDSAYPLSHNRTISVDVYSRDPTFLDVAECFERECLSQAKALTISPYVSDAAHCVSPAFGPCLPKAWDCLGDDVCRKALECLPEVAQQCGQKLWDVLIDATEREKIACIWECGNKTSCVIEKCGKNAAECLIGEDKLCHQAMVCVPEQLLACSKPAISCVFSKDGVCRDNLKCVAKGANVCADPVVNLATDTSIATLMTCANQKCPAPMGTPPLAQGEELLVKGGATEPAAAAPPAHYPEQLACMGLKCTGKAMGLFKDKAIRTLSTCLITGIEGGCANTLWSCLGNSSCSREVACWADGAQDDVKDNLKLVTDKDERLFDEGLFFCATGCFKNHTHSVMQGQCILTTCGRKAAACFFDAKCRKVFTDLPKTVAKCTLASVKDPLFMKSAACVAQMGDACGRAGLDLLRDTQLADLVKCNAQCTRPPTTPAPQVVLMV